MSSYKPVPHCLSIVCCTHYKRTHTNTQAYWSIIQNSSISIWLKSKRLAWVHLKMKSASSQPLKTVSLMCMYCSLESINTSSSFCSSCVCFYTSLFFFIFVMSLCSLCCTFLHCLLFIFCTLIEPSLLHNFSSFFFFYSRATCLFLFCSFFFHSAYLVV